MIDNQVDNNYILLGLGILFFVTVIIVGGVNMLEEYLVYNDYKDFCEERPNFCYCSLWEGGCEFKASSSTQYINGILVSSSMSNDTKELCELATKLKDKKTLFKVGCK